MKDYEKTIAQTLTDAQTTLEGLSNAEAQRRAQEAEDSLRDRLGEDLHTPAANQLRDIQKLAEERPEIIANLLRNWLTDDFGG